ncbi:hypothetical protein J6590_054505 [Homalodisca vitripennis]|nr:hypothetical protein J6590_054505 [Homalodisca vitripennis]
MVHCSAFSAVDDEIRFTSLELKGQAFSFPYDHSGRGWVALLDIDTRLPSIVVMRQRIKLSSTTTHYVSVCLRRAVRSPHRLPCLLSHPPRSGLSLVPLLRTTCPYVSAVPFVPLTGYHAFSLTRRDRGRNYVVIDTRLPSIVVMRQRSKLSSTTTHYVSVCLRRAVRSPHRLPCLLSHPPRSWQELRGHRHPAPIHLNLVPLLRTTCPYVSAVPFAPLTGYHAFSLTRRDRGRNYVDIDTRLPSIVVMRQRIKLSYTTMHYVSVCLRRAVRSPHRLPCLLSHPPRSWQELRGHRHPAPIHLNLVPLLRTTCPYVSAVPFAPLTGYHAFSLTRRDRGRNYVVIDTRLPSIFHYYALRVRMSPPCRSPLTGYHAFSLTRRDRGRNYVDIDTRLPSIVVMRQRIKLSSTTTHYVSVCLRRAVRSPHRLPCLLSHPPRSWQELRGHRQPAPIHRCDAAAD